MPDLLAAVSYSDLNKEYRRQYRIKHGAFDYIFKKGLKIRNGVLMIDWAAEGSQVEPEYFVTSRYRLEGNSLRPVGNPGRRPCFSECSWENGLSK